jgi:hypothetical protein
MISRIPTIESKWTARCKSINQPMQMIETNLEWHLSGNNEMKLDHKAASSLLSPDCFFTQQINEGCIPDWSSLVSQ